MPSRRSPSDTTCPRWSSHPRQRRQSYFFKVLQEQDSATRITVTIDVTSAGIPGEALDTRIIEGLDQLGIDVTWEWRPAEL